MPIKIHKFPLGQMATNCYLLIQNEECILIDPADDADFILSQIFRRKLNLFAILATHGHFDHIMAAGEIQIHLPHIPFFIHPKDAFLLNRVVDTARHFLDYDPVILPLSSYKNLIVGELHISSFSLNIIHTPGHTPGSCSLYFAQEKVLFAGDLVFREEVGRTDFSYSDSRMLRKSITHLLEVLPEDTVVYSGHGEEFMLEELKR